MKIQNPHDKFFKESWSNLPVARDFLKNYLPQSLSQIVDLNTLEPQKDSFINEELQESFSDLLFKADINHRAGYIYFLFEHKSYPSKEIAFQLLKYMVEIWEAKIKKEKANELPIIIPLVIYHGKESWNVKTALGEMITGYEELPSDVKEYIPNYRFSFYDVSRFTDEQILGEAWTRMALFALRDIHAKQSKEARLDSIDRALKYLGELADKQTGIEYIETWMRYVFSAKADMTKADVDEILERIGRTYPEGSGVIMTLAEIFREEGKEEGIIKGMEKGLKEGEARALAKTAIKLLTKKFGLLTEDARVKIEKLDAVTLEVILDEIMEYKSLDDVKKYIQ